MRFRSSLWRHIAFHVVWFLVASVQVACEDADSFVCKVTIVCWVHVAATFARNASYRTCKVVVTGIYIDLIDVQFIGLVYHTTRLDFDLTMIFKTFWSLLVQNMSEYNWWSKYIFTVTCCSMFHVCRCWCWKIRSIERRLTFPLSWILADYVIALLGIAVPNYQCSSYFSAMKLVSKQPLEAQLRSFADLLVSKAHIGWTKSVAQ